MKLAPILCNNSYLPARNAAKAVDVMQKILPPIGIRAASDSCLGAERMEGGGAAGAEISYIGFENNKAERVVGRLAKNVAEPTELRTKNKR